MSFTRSKLYFVTLPSIGIPLAVVALLGIDKVPLGPWTQVFPHVNAVVNSLTALLLLIAWWSIMQRNVVWHRRCIRGSVLLGVVFLVAYLLYHMSNPSVVYGDVDHDGVLSAAEQAAIRGSRQVYLALLISHIALALFVVWFVLRALFYAELGQFKAHKRVVRWAFPLWLYVSISGVAVYLLIRPYY